MAVIENVCQDVQYVWTMDIRTQITATLVIARKALEGDIVKRNHRLREQIAEGISKPIESGKPSTRLSLEILGNLHIRFIAIIILK